MKNHFSPSALAHADIYDYELMSTSWAGNSRTA